MRDLETDPLCKPEDLGKSIPDHPHAVSVCLPTWDSVIRYEEGDPEVLARDIEERTATVEKRKAELAKIDHKIDLVRRQIASRSCLGALPGRPAGRKG